MPKVVIKNPGRSVQETLLHNLLELEKSGIHDFDWKMNKENEYVNGFLVEVFDIFCFYLDFVVLRKCHALFCTELKNRIISQNTRSQYVLCIDLT